MTMDRTAFLKTCTGHYDDLKRQLDTFRLELKLGSMEARDKKKQIVADLEAGLQRAKQEIERLRAAGDKDWKQFSAKAESAWKDLAEGVKKAAKHFGKDDQAAT